MTTIVIDRIDNDEEVAVSKEGYERLQNMEIE